MQTIRHPVLADGTLRYRFTFNVSIDPVVATGDPSALGRQFMDALLESLLQAMRQERPHG